MFRIIFLFVLLFLCYSCNKKENVKEFTLESFSETIQLKGAVVKTDKELFFPRDIVVDNNSAIILDDESGGNIIHVFDLSAHQLKQSLLQKGKGPGEILGGWQLSLNEKTGSVCLLDVVKESIYLLYNGNKKGSNKEFGGNTILVFDWKGKPQYIFELDKHIIAFDFDKETNTLYAISHISAEEYLIRYKLPNDLVL